MKKHNLLFTSILIMSLSSAVNATGRMTCDSGDQDSWKTMDQLQSVIESEGWKVRKIKVDGGCYEVYGSTPEGKRVEAYFDPLTLEKLLVAQRGKILFKK